MFGSKKKREAERQFELGKQHALAKRPPDPGRGVPVSYRIGYQEGLRLKEFLEIVDGWEREYVNKMVG